MPSPFSLHIGLLSLLYRAEILTFSVYVFMTIKLNKNSYKKIDKPMDQPDFLNAQFILICCVLEGSWDKGYIRTKCVVSSPLWRCSSRNFRGGRLFRHDVLYLRDLACFIPSIWVLLHLVFLPSFCLLLKMQLSEAFLDTAFSYFPSYRLWKKNRRGRIGQGKPCNWNAVMKVIAGPMGHSRAKLVCM